MEKWKNNGFDKKNKGLIAITVLGFLTQYFFLFYCLLLAAVTAVILLYRHRNKELWCYIRSMVIAAVIGLVLFPFAISDVFSSGRGTEALGNLASGFAGYGQRLAAFGRILADRTVGAPLLTGGCAAGAILLLGKLYLSFRAGKQEQKGENSGRDAAWMLMVPVAGYFLLASRMSPYLVDRYIMPLFPFVALLLALLLCLLGKKLTEISGWKEQIVGGMLVLLLVVVQGLRLAAYDGEYLYQGYASQEALAEEYEEFPCICVYAGVGYYENLPEFMHYTKTLLVTAEELKERKDTESVEALNRVIVLIKPGVDKEATVSVLRDKYGYTSEELLLSEGVHGDMIYMFSR